MERELAKHPDRLFVDTFLDGLRNGFDTGVSELPTMSYKCKNLRSCAENRDYVTTSIADEIEKGYLIGPYDSDACPFPVFRINSIGVVTGKYSGKKRLILVLSSPHNKCEHTSINDLISKADYSLSYTRIDDAISIIKRLGMGSIMNHLDIREAFKILGIAPRLWHLYGLQWKGNIYFYTRLCFGCRSSPKLFTMLSQAVQFIATENYGISNLLYLLDDFLTIDRTMLEAQRSMALMTMIFNGLGIPISHHKTEGPTAVIKYLGITLDSVRMEARLPTDKLSRLNGLLLDYRTKIKCKKRELLSLLGHLCYAARVASVGRTFMARLLEVAKRTQHLWSYVTLDNDCKADIEMWLCILQRWNGISMFLDSELTHMEEINVLTDSSRYGFGGYNRSTGQWFHGTWEHHAPNIDQTSSMALLELYPLVVSACLWGSLWSRKHILYHCDNSSTCHILSKKRSKCPQIMKLMRRFTIEAAIHSFDFKSKWLPTTQNVISDALSRGRISLFQELAPEAAPAPEPIPRLLFT